jgi:hypothetical protein
LASYLRIPDNFTCKGYRIIRLELIQASLKGVGLIYTTGSRVYFRVTSIKDLSVIIAHFDKYPLLTQKRADFLLFKLASPPSPPTHPAIEDRSGDPRLVKRKGGGGDASHLSKREGDAIEMINRGEHLTTEGLRKIVAIRVSIN